MKVLILDAPKELLEERRRLGIDGRDEMWDGVPHVVPPPGGPHQRMSGAFFLATGPLAQARGLAPHFETGLFDTESNYRVPDLLFCRPDHLSERGAEGAELVVEFRSPGDESYAKLDFYATMGVREVLVAHLKPRRVELFRLVEGRLLPATADAAGEHVCEVLGIRLSSVDGALRLTWPGGTADV